MDQRTLENLAIPKKNIRYGDYRQYPEDLRKSQKDTWG